MTGWIKKYGHHYLMLAPFFLLFFIFFLYPILYGFKTSFTDWDGIHTPVFIGLDNYTKIIHSKQFTQSFSNLLLYVALTVPAGIGTAFILAVLVNSFSKKWSDFFRSAYFIPTVIPLFLAASIWRWMYAPEYGFINLILKWLGLSSVSWLTDPHVMMFSLVIVDVWISAGFNMVILLAGLNDIPDVYYDAAKVDGANKWQEIIHITLPLLEPVLFFSVSYGIISALQVFDAPWLLTASDYLNYGGRRGRLLFPVMHMVGQAFGALKFGQAAAYGFLLTVLILLLTAIQFLIRKKK
ncbi:MAG TPA: sugar ABC transporter permease [Anaerolineaceae bacterium]|nr:sugar ABC transporter permease [Anaerolineaceae bacterium]